MAVENLGRRIFLKDDRLRPILRVLVFLVATVLATLFLLRLIGSLMNVRPPRAGGIPNLPFEEQAIFEFASAAAVVGVALLLRCYLDRRSIASLGFAFRSGWLRLLALGVVLGAGMQLLVFAMEEFLGYSRVAAYAGTQSDAIELAQYLPFFVVAALAEEMLVRGYVFQNLWEEWGAPAGIVLTAGLFAVLHLGNPNSHANLWFTLAGLAAFGVWACLSFMWTRSLWLALGAHFAWNVLEGPVLGFPVSGFSFGTTALTQKIGGPAWFTGGAFGPESGASSLIALVAGLAFLYWLYRRGAFAAAYDAREAYALGANEKKQDG
jgi:membrane protease YdiL (CAAX protease family)